MHELLDAFKVDPNTIEIIEIARKLVEWKRGFEIEVTKNKEEALVAERKMHTERWRVYCNGSEIDGKVRVVAVMYKGARRVKTLRYHLGGAEEHTIYEAELVGIVLGTELLKREERIMEGTISLDNMAAIVVTGLTKSAPGHYLINMVHQGMEEVRKKHRLLARRLRLRWVPGHRNVEGNEVSDAEAKEAAVGCSSPKSQLPTLLQNSLWRSISAVKRIYGEHIEKEHTEAFQKSARYAIMSNRPQRPFYKVLENCQQAGAATCQHLSAAANRAHRVKLASPSYRGMGDAALRGMQFGQQDSLSFHNAVPQFHSTANGLACGCGGQAVADVSLDDREEADTCIVELCDSNATTGKALWREKEVGR